MQPKKKIKDNSNSQNYYAGKGWIKQGLYAGFFMYIFMTILLNPLINERPNTLKDLLIGLPIWLIFGLCQGYLIKKLNKKKN